MDANNAEEEEQHVSYRLMHSFHIQFGMKQIVMSA